MKAISIRAKDSTVALKMQKNARNSEIDSITKIIAIILFVCFNESQIRRAMIRKMTEIATIVTRRDILLKIVLSLNRKILKSTL